MNTLFTPFTIGAVELRNRIVMAPLTRARSNPERIPNDLMLEYYRQRAAFGLIITEATIISPQGAGWPNTPGIYNKAQVLAWLRITDMIHAHDGRIFLQLWHMGRSSNRDLQPGRALPVAPSAIAIRGEFSYGKTYPVPRALEPGEIPGIVADYARATRLAREAGFDGVELHGANGYLIDQFLRDGSNRRTDRYGGSVENRARFMLEVTEACVAAWSADRVAIRLSPTGVFGDMRDSDPAATFGYAAAQLNRFGLAYLHVFEPGPDHPFGTPLPPVAPLMRKIFKGPYILNGGLDGVNGARAIDEGRADLVAYGVPALANPDLVERIRIGAAFNPPDVATFYTHEAKGYTDYPTLEEAGLAAAR